MLEHLVQQQPDVTDPGNFKEVGKAAPEEILDAQLETASWLEELGVPPDDEVVAQTEKEFARESFRALATAADTPAQKEALAKLKTPTAVRHLTGMLTAYDWEFIEQAKELRGYTVAQILEETKNPNPNIRLKALQLLGKVTEVGLFTEKIEVKKTEMSDSELEQRIKEKLNRFMGVVDVVDVSDNEEKTDDANPN